jgi:hypothetical protein
MFTTHIPVDSELIFSIETNFMWIRSESDIRMFYGGYRGFTFKGMFLFEDKTDYLMVHLTISNVDGILETYQETSFFHKRGSDIKDGVCDWLSHEVNAIEDLITNKVDLIKAMP